MVDSYPISFGRYTLVERLAMGGMAELFLATAPGEHGFQKKVVIKRLLPHLAREPVYTAMFIDEAKLTAALVHPKIAQTHELGRFENDLFIAMEFVDGIDVLALLREHAWLRKRIPVEQAVWICHEVLDALDFAHNLADERGQSLGIVHRDISPSNVLLSRRGDVKLVDFGIARASAAGRHHRTKSGTLKGKYGYMSPEQVTEQPIDARSDLFSVGVVLAEMLCGRRLFAAAAEIDVLLMVRDARLTRLDQFGGHIPPALDQILRKALRKEPDERWSSAAELRDVLADWLFQERLRVGPRQIAELVESFHDTAWRRRRESMAKAAAAVEAAGQAAEAAVDPAAEQTLTPGTGVSPEPLGPPPADPRLEPPGLDLSVLDPRASAVDTGLIQAPDGLRRRRPASTDGLPIIEAVAEPLYLEVSQPMSVQRADVAPARAESEITGPVALVEDSVDLDLADLTEPPGLELDPPGSRPLWTPDADPEPLLNPPTDPRVRRVAAALDGGLDPDLGLPGRGPASSPALKPTRGPEPVRELQRPASSPALEPFGRASNARQVPQAQPRVPSAPVATPSARAASSPALARPAGLADPAPVAARPPPSGPIPLLFDDDDDLGLGPAGFRHEASTSGPSAAPPSGPVAAPLTARGSTPPPRPSRLEIEPSRRPELEPVRRSEPEPARTQRPEEQPPARGSTPDLQPASLISDLDPPVPPPSRGGPSPSTVRNERTSQPIMSAAARNRAMSTSPPVAPPVDATAATRRPGPRVQAPPGRGGFLGDELDALADDIDAAVQQLQVPVAEGETSGPLPRTRSGDTWPAGDFDESTGGGRARPRPPSASDEAARARRASEAPAPELGTPTARGDFAQNPPMTVLFRLAVAGATGLLTAAVGGIRKEIYVRAGVAEYVTSNMASELLGNYLVARGALSSGELAMALAMMPHYGGKLGDTLVGLGLLKPLEVFRYLNHQVREKLIDVCTWTKGGYAWYEGRVNQRNAFPIDLNQFEVLGAGAMAVRDDVVAGWMQQVGAARAVRVRARPAIELERFEIAGLAAMYDKADGTRTVGELVTDALDPGHQRRLARMLRLLVQCELVRLEG